MLKHIQNWFEARRKRKEEKEYKEGYDQAVGAVLRGEIEARDLRYEIESYASTPLEFQHYDLGALDGLDALSQISVSSVASVLAQMKGHSDL